MPRLELRATLLDPGAMGSISVRRQDGSTFVVRTTKKTRFVRLLHENPVHVDLSAIGETPALEELSLSSSSVLDALDLTPLAHHPALGSLTATVAKPPDLAPLASTRMTRLSIDLDGREVLDFRPLHGHATLAHLALGFLGTQSELDLSFVRELPALESLSIDGGDWKTLDLSPLEGLPLTSFTLARQYVAEVDLSILAQPALEHLMLQDLEIHQGYLSLLPLAKCTKLRFLSLAGAEVGTLEVTALSKLKDLARFDPPNFKSMMMDPSGTPILSKGLARWEASIGIE